MDCIDLYYLHRDDPDLPISEIMEMLNTFVRAGKIRALNPNAYRMSITGAAEQCRSAE